MNDLYAVSYDELDEASCEYENGSYFIRRLHDLVVVGITEKRHKEYADVFSLTDLWECWKNAVWSY